MSVFEGDYSLISHGSHLGLKITAVVLFNPRWLPREISVWPTNSTNESGGSWVGAEKDNARMPLVLQAYL